MNPWLYKCVLNFKKQFQAKQKDSAKQKTVVSKKKSYGMEERILTIEQQILTGAKVDRDIEYLYKRDMRLPEYRELQMFKNEYLLEPMELITNEWDMCFVEFRALQEFKKQNISSWNPNSVRIYIH